LERRLSAAGVGTMLAALNVAYRDFCYIIHSGRKYGICDADDLIRFGPDGSQLGMGEQLLPLNPMTGFIASFRAALLNQDIPWRDLGFSATMASVFFLVGCYYFRRVEDTIADVIR
jgi:lipopolysaccharide transport system permease protein